MMTRPQLAALALLLVLVFGSSAASAAPPARPPLPWPDKVDPWVLETGADGTTEFLVYLADQADLAPAAALRTKDERGAFVYRTLSQHAERTQGLLRRQLNDMGVAYQPFWVANMIWVRGDLNVVQALARRGDVARIYANPTARLDAPETNVQPAAVASQPESIEWNIGKVRAAEVWAAGVRGAGAVIGGQDTGYLWTHNALKSKYRGWSGSEVDHDYNWHDAIHTTAHNSSCGVNSPAPCDDFGHGTHTMGTMVGDDGAGNQVGMAPDAKWIGCRNMDEGYGTPATYSECYQWFIAPTRVDGSDPDPSKAPDVIDNSWACPESEGCVTPDALRAVVQSVTAAGIVTVHSAGNSGSACSTVNTPAAIYAESFTVGSTDSTDGIAGTSSRGPVTIDGSGRIKPDVSAPGVGVRSTAYREGGDSYTVMSGTSMAAPHVAGLVALMISANPGLRGNVTLIRDMIEQSAIHLTNMQSCGDLAPPAVPNNVYGWGRIDAYAAYERAVACYVPDVAISWLNETQVKLAWSPKTGVTSYRVHWSLAPYFIPGTTCDAGSCREVAGTEDTFDVPGNATGNYTYLVQIGSEDCEAAPFPPSNRVGEFDFGLLP